ncbi:MAG: bifunctional glutamate N-acetyltransferase/amino-acid acetyltransferase ArgJ [Oscillospiraceae bacterium]|jgi:glutamate N-acetyltransferase/amino-acid N-acetyltransferase|nr:bifunctional glutamate N-acetyltransferase/amino-acid acetyltransferase ArgJ [Oscillospiraceae bacterium]
MEWIDNGVCAPKGFRAAGVHCGIRKNASKKDLALIISDAQCTAAAVYTRNKVFGAPIAVTREHLSDGLARAVLCNSGNANTCNADGVDIANAMCDLLAKEAGISADDVIIASTGVIGQPLPLDAIESGIPPLVAQARSDGAMDAAQAIMTTDTREKQAAVSFELSGAACAIGAMCKGSGMIAPNMATMLCFVTTDAAISAPLLHRALFRAVDETFNRVVVDGDTSTNDMVSILANGMCGNPPIEAEGADFFAFQDALIQALTRLAREVARDGEGATRLITVKVKGANDDELARAVARSVVTSPLCKAALFGADANWGRILCAIGYTPGDFSVDDISVVIASDHGELLLCENGSGVPFSETQARTILLAPEVELLIDMGRGGGAATAWGCDLSYEYVRINGDYRT